MNTKTKLAYLDYLESEAIYILREVVGQFERPLMLYSLGKDSSVLLHLARKAFSPGSLPFPLLHVDTGYKFKEMYEFRDKQQEENDLTLHVHRNEDAIADGTHPSQLGTARCCGLLKTQALLSALRKHKCDAAIGGARRDEEKSRAKERIFSFRDKHGKWEPRKQRPELWQVLNGKINPQESIRVFPLSNWTEEDIWLYIKREDIPLVPLYFAEKRNVVVRGNQLIPVTEHTRIAEHEHVEEVMCRFRTLGCTPCTGAVRSTATSVDDIIEEMKTMKLSERSTRIIDHASNEAMEDKKRDGYF